jgi:hypothetical protein
MLRQITQRINADIYKKIEANQHDYSLSISKTITNELGESMRPFVFRIDGANRTRRFFYVNTVYMEPNLERWKPLSPDGSCLFIPRYGNFVLIYDHDLHKLNLPEFAVKGSFVMNIFYTDILLVQTTFSVLLCHIRTGLSAVYTFDFPIADAIMLNSEIIQLTLTDGTKTRYNRLEMDFF